MNHDENIKPKEWSSNMDILISYILQIGVLLSAVFLLAGIVWRWLITGSPRLDYALSGTNLFEFWMTDIRQATSGEFRPRLLVNLGIALLLVTPYLRVAASVVYFGFVLRNLKYTLFTSLVLSILTYSLFLR
jgi:uncharacterized membrane protein